MNTSGQMRDVVGTRNGTSKGGRPGTDARRGSELEIMSARTLVGGGVCNEKGEDLGEIKDIMLDIRTGRVGYAVLFLGGFLGMGARLSAVPWTALVFDTKKKRFVLKVDKEDHWSDMADHSWERKIDS